MTIQCHTASFREGTTHPLKAFQKMLGLMAVASPVLKLGLLHMRPIQFWLKQRVPSAAWHHGHHRVTVTRACVSALARWRVLFWLKQCVILDTAHKRKVVTTNASNKGWVAVCKGKPTFGLWSEEESGLHINCLEMLAVCQACQFFLPDISCASTLRQQVCVVIHKSPRQPHLEVPLLAGERPSCVGSEQSALTEGDACAGQYKPRSRHVVDEQCLFRGMDAPPTRGSENLGNGLANEWPSLPLYAFLPVTLLPQVLRRVREQRHKLILIATLWTNQP